ncbi:MAG: exonuclease SbcCD subunit D [Spirochaetales bacterium]|nr:exonuclease SbcCD subunit D [Spirochaetales bacterium]
MKIIHLADLHLGKRVNEFSMCEDQKYIINQILEIIDEKKPDCMIIAGDVYDKSVPPVEAVELLDYFLIQLSNRKLPVFIISGNHDSPERLAFGSSLMESSQVFVSPAYDGTVKKITLNDDFGAVNFYLLPFIKPTTVRQFFPEERIEDYNDAVKAALKNLNLNKKERNVLVAHQFVTGAQTCDSEEKSVGGMDNVSAELFFDFDYTALGHIHGPQKIIRENIRYSGTPLKYSFSECKHKKSVLFIELKEKENFSYECIPLKPLHDMREIKGTYDQIMLKKNYENTNTEDYVHITLTDEEDIPEVFSKLRTVYKNLMKIDYDNLRTQSYKNISENIVETASPLALFENFYELQNNSKLDEESRKFLISQIEEIWEK